VIVAIANPGRELRGNVESGMTTRSLALVVFAGAIGIAALGSTVVGSQATGAQAPPRQAVCSYAGEDAAVLQTWMNTQLLSAGKREFVSVGRVICAW